MCDNLKIHSHSIHCEHNNVTLIRLDEALKESSIIQNSHLCVTAEKSEIKEKLKEACRKEEKVQIARQYCLEEHEGKYYCLKDGKCFGHLCKGCIKHECEVKGQKKIMNPPESYIQEALDSGFTYDPKVADTINVDDHSELNHLREWCTQVRCLKITGKVSFNIASEASYVYILSGQKLVKNAKNAQFGEFLKH